MNFKLFEESTVLKEISQQVTSLDNYEEYRKSLKVLQTDVNQFLTELVEKNQKAKELEAEIEDPDVEVLDTDSEEDKSLKRISSSERMPEKNKVHKK